MKKPGYVLDSFAILAYFQDESGGPKVRDLLKQAGAGDALIFMSTINLGEVVYIVGRKLGDDAAVDILHDVKHLPIQLIEATMDRVLAAALIKAHHAISYADSFVVALAQELKAKVVTSDPEFKKVDTLIELLWL